MADVRCPEPRSGGSDRAPAPSRIADSARRRARRGPLPRQLLLAACTLVACTAVGSCGSEDPPAVSVGPVGYSEDQLLGISEARRASLAEMTAFGLAVADSTTDSLGAPLVREWIEDRRLEILSAQLVLEANDIGDDVLEARYLADPEWELTVRHILFFSERWRSPAHRAQAREKAERAMDALQEGADFASTAAALSEEPGAEGRQGLLTPGREGSWVPEFWAAALALEPGEISPITETQYGYHILRLEDRQVVPFEEARSSVAREVAPEIADPQEALESWMAENADAAEAAPAAGTLDARQAGDSPEAQQADSTPAARRADSPEAQRAAALAEAEARGITVPEGERAEIERAWEDMVYRWSATLGFRYGRSSAEVAETAMAALSDPAQETRLVRDEISAHRDLLEARYDIRVGAAEGEA